MQAPLVHDPVILLTDKLIVVACSTYPDTSVTHVTERTQYGTLTIDDTLSSVSKMDSIVDALAIVLNFWRSRNMQKKHNYHVHAKSFFKGQLQRNFISINELLLHQITIYVIKSL